MSDELNDNKLESKSESDKHRITTRLSADLYNQVKYWAGKKDLSESEYLSECIEHRIRYENKDYDLPTLEVSRLNQLVEVVNIMSSTLKGLEIMMINGFDMLSKLDEG